jgi:Icc-related predicted phosphoesterase
MTSLRIVLSSDTHGRHGDLVVPDGDLFVHAGDFTKRGRLEEVQSFAAWLEALPHRHKIVVAGNHDFLFERDPARARALLACATYLEHEGAVAGGLTVFGSPWQPWFHDWAFNLRRGAALAEKWAGVPSGVHVLVTHSPPRGVLDRTWGGENVGCDDLLAALPRIEPRLHVFGHIHEAYGTRVESSGRLTVNASNCDLSYRAVHPLVVVDWDGAEMRAVPPR